MRVGTGLTETPTEHDLLYADQVALIYRQALLGYLLNLVVAVLLCFTQRPAIADAQIVWWFTLFSLVLVARIVLVLGYRRHAPVQGIAARPWGRAYLFSATLGGLSWGSTVVFLFPPTLTEYQAFLALILAGMTAGPIARLAARQEIALAYVVPVLLPLAIQCLRQEHSLTQMMGWMSLLFLLWLIAVTRQTYRAIRGALKLKRENQALVQQLEKEKNSLEARVQARTAALRREMADRRSYEQELAHLADHDALTQLANRRRLVDRLSRSLAQARHHHKGVAVFYLDLDRFKLINDTLGHAAGDQLLQAVAGRLIDCVREVDTVARLGGDEFALVLESVTQLSQAQLAGERLLDAMRTPFSIDGQSFYINASIGASWFPDDGDDVNTLLKRADIALRQVKTQGRRNLRFYTSSMEPDTRQRLTLETELRQAIDRNQLLLHYQPQLNAATGQFIGVEALLRWQHPDRGLIPATVLIPLAEESGLIVPIGDWVLTEACTQLHRWHQQGLTELHVAVNLSAPQFLHVNLAQRIEQILHQIGLTPAALHLEITESLLMQDVTRTVETLDTLSTMGVQLAIDDFGTGYSSLSYLKRFPLNWLKIDRAFIRDVTTNTDDAAITGAIIAMAHQLKLAVVAEGVETAEQQAFLQAGGCDVMQGYWFSRPIPAADIPEFAQQTIR